MRPATGMSLPVKIDGKTKNSHEHPPARHRFRHDEELLKLFAEVDTNPDHQYMKTTIERDLGVKD